jgi:hypothetical protein
MIKPCHPGSSGEQNLKLRIPPVPLQWQQPRLEIAQPVAVKIKVPRLVFQDKRARFFQDRITSARLEQTIVGGTDQFSDDQKLNFKFESDGVAEEAKKRICPMPLNRPAAEADYKPLEQTRVFRFFSYEQLQRLMIRDIIGRLCPRVGEQEFALSCLAKLKVRQRTSEYFLRAGIEWTRNVPFWFRPMVFVILKVSKPLL